MKRPVLEKLQLKLQDFRAKNIIVAAIIAFLAWQIITVAASASPSICLGCHESREQVKSLERSPHAGINCVYCHNDEVVLSLLSLQIRSTSHTFTHFLKPKKPVKPSEITDITCNKCHSIIMKKTVQKNGIKVSHKEIVGAGWSCIDCHGATAHQVKSRVRNHASMNDCMTCHNGATASNDCGYCHKKDIALNRTAEFKPLSVIHGEDWKKTHGMGDMNSCKDCHKTDFCGQCHKAELPHPQPWAYLHTQSKADTSECYKCHSKDYCNGCHSMEMPHPVDFLPNHVAITNEKGMDVCWSCHKKESCEDCHRNAAHPKVPRF